MVDASGHRVIGQRAGDAEGVQWIRGLRSGETQLRILQPTVDWWKYREHYKAKLYFACNSSTSEASPEECIGCADPDVKTHQVSYRFAFNALDKDGRVRVFKAPSGLRKKLNSRENSLGGDVLLRRDVVLLKDGTGLETEYGYEWGEEYDLGDKMPDPDKLHNLGEVVTASYWEAVRRLEAGELDEDGNEPEGDESVVDDPAPDPEPEPEKPRKTAAKKTAAKKTAAKKTVAAEPEESGDEPQSVGDFGDEVDPSEAIEAAMEKIKALPDTDDIRALLEENGVEFPARAPRPRILAIAEQALIDGKLPPF